MLTWEIDQEQWGLLAPTALGSSPWEFVNIMEFEQILATRGHNQDI
jgi:hypothetical protein